MVNVKERAPSRGEVAAGRIRTCIDCGDVKIVQSYHPEVKRCLICAAKHHRSENHWNWKGGIRWNQGDGYFRILLPHDSPYISMADKGRRILEHRLVMAEHLGRCLSLSERVHHVNGDRGDNRIQNLELISQANHSILQRLCFTCELRKDIKLLRLQNKILLEQVRELNLKFMEGSRYGSN